ncbi:hypothetical protein [Bacillus mycoides]|uniref:hypothetical protein n=1 Tax=Bacillus mycoides TaxID=1405 RepID=UPI003A8126EE
MLEAVDVPVILVKQEKIVLWVLNGVRLGYLPVSVGREPACVSAIECLDCDEPVKRELNTRGYVGMWKLYNSYTREQKDVMNQAVLAGAYRLTTDIKEGQVVTDGNHVGFASEFDYRWTKRVFKLASSKQGSVDWCPTHKIGEFKKVIQK